jgi:hypothetical protein
MRIKNLVYLSGRNNQHYAQVCTTALFYILAPTCFDCSLLSSESFWIRLSYMKIQIDLVVYHIMCGYVACVSECHGWNHNTPTHRPLNQHYMIFYQIDRYFLVTQTDPEPPR